MQLNYDVVSPALLSLIGMSLNVFLYVSIIITDTILVFYRPVILQWPLLIAVELEQIIRAMSGTSAS